MPENNTTADTTKNARRRGPVVPGTGAKIADVIPVAEHIAAHFALEDPTYDLRENELSLSEAEWEPAVTTEELLETYAKALIQAQAMPVSVPLEIPAYPAQISPDGDERYEHINELDPAGRINAVLVALAESIALDKAAQDAYERAIITATYCNVF